METKATANAITIKQLLTVKEVSRITGFSRSTIYKLFHKGEFPPPIKFGRSVRWRLADIETAIQGKVTR